MKWIKSGDLKNWAETDQRHCSQTLPELIRRLIFATSNHKNIEEIKFPSGDSIVTSGWDGVLTTSELSPFFPNGISRWEMGTDKSPGNKANKDYEKRTSEPLGAKKKDTTFVFVTPRPWRDKNKWKKNKLLEKKWKDIKVIASDELEQWLELAPAVSIWLGKQIKGLVDDISDLESFWEEWSSATKPKITTELVLGGRIKDMDNIKNWILDAPSILEVKGDSLDEPFAFLYSSICNLQENEKTKTLSRSVIVKNIEQFRSCILNFKQNLIIIAPSECSEIAGLALEKGHHVFISTDSRSINTHGNILELSRPKRLSIKNSLINSGLLEKKSEQITRDFGISIPILHRNLLISNLRTPLWANNITKELIILLFINTWNENINGDRDIIEKLYGNNYDTFIKEVQVILLMDNSPISKIGSIWTLKSPLDFCFIVSRYINENDLENFKEIVCVVLSEIDPKYELEPEKRWMASIYGKSNAYSEYIKKGMIESLTLIALYGRKPKDNIQSNQFFVDGVVYEILKEKNTWESWSSIKRITPLIAEASPNVFMDKIEQLLKDNYILFQELMSSDENSGLFGECKHCGLLWALESISWSTEYFSRSVNILFDLTKIDIGGNWNNRPINSLKHIFLPGCPQTNAIPDERLTVLEELIKKDPKTVWSFAKDYFNDGVISASNTFHWRNMDENRTGLDIENNEDHIKYVSGLLSKLKDISSVKENIPSSLEDFIRLPDDIKSKIILFLLDIDIKEFIDDDIDKIAMKIRSILHWINNYGDKNYYKYIENLNNILYKFTPSDTFRKLHWLLSNPWPELPEKEKEKYEERDLQIINARKNAAREILDNEPFDKIINYSKTINYISSLGDILGKSIKNKLEDSNFLDEMILSIPETQGIIFGYTISRIEIIGDTWLDEQIKRIKSKGTYSHEVCAVLCLGLKNTKENWIKISSYGIEVEKIYWERVNIQYLEKKEDTEMAVEKLLYVNRPEIAFKISAHRDILLPSKLLKQILEDILKIAEDRIKRSIESHNIGYIFEQIYKKSELSVDEIIKLEWPYAAFFEDIKEKTKQPMKIHMAINSNPSLFSQLISFIYKPKNNKNINNEENINKDLLENRANISRKVLDSFDLIPGIDDNGIIDENQLIKWIKEARQNCKDIDRETPCDIEIGFILAGSSYGKDGVWPDVPIRNFIENHSNKVILDHIKNKVYNNRGGTSRSMDDGGKQERDISKKYRRMGETLRLKWPKTSSVLLSIAEHYDNEAQYNDIESELYNVVSN